MWAANYWGIRFWCRNYWAKVGLTPVVTFSPYWMNVQHRIPAVPSER